jgi:hypothetical protein
VSEQKDRSNRPNMKKNIFIFIGIVLLFTACKKDDPVPMPQGIFTADSVMGNMPVRFFTKDGENRDPAIIDKVLNEYDNYIPDSWDISFTSVELQDGQIRIHNSFIEYTFMNEMIKYDYIRNGELLFLEMQDSITITASYSDYYVQLFNTLNVYPLPEFKEEFIAAETGFYTVSKYKDKRYVEIIDENTLRMHFTKFLYVVNYTKPAYQVFWILPVELNNYFKETGYPAIKKEDAILVKEFEVEYRKNSQ